MFLWIYVKISNASHESIIQYEIIDTQNLSIAYIIICTFISFYLLAKTWGMRV